MSDAFLARYTRDGCKYALHHVKSNQHITGATVSAENNNCQEPIPVTFPVAPTDTKGFKTEQIGADPLTVWVKLSGSPVSFDLSEPIPL